MFSTIVSIKKGKKSEKKRVAIRFGRPTADTTTCELKIGGKNTEPKAMKNVYHGTTTRISPDSFDKVRGHMNSLGQALDNAGVNRKARREIYKSYAVWAAENHIHTEIAVENIGR